MTRIDIDGLIDFIKDKAITELKEKIKELEDKLTDSYKEVDRWLTEYIIVHDNFKKLVEKNEELKEKINSLVCSENCYKHKQASKYKQALTEIKEIIEFNKTNRLSGGACISIEQVLRKISEVLDERV